MGRRQIECDPLAFSGWMISATASQWLGDFDAALETARQGYATTGHRITFMNIVGSLIISGRFDEAKAIIDREIRDDAGRLYWLVRISAAQGDEVTAKALLARYEPVSTQKNDLLTTFSVTGHRQRANEIAAEIDATPFGYLTLIRLIHGCLCGAPFDLDATPDFAKRVEDADLPWPPQSPASWPLKDW